MHNKIIVTAETGSDITPELAKELGVYIVPMHVQIGGVTLDDGAFPVEDICDYYNKTGKVPKTSGSTPYDFEKALAQMHEENPDKEILYLAYSAITTCSYQSAQVASQGMDFFYSVDTKHVSVGQSVCVRELVKYLNENPDCTMEEAVKKAEEIRTKVQMSFIPNNLDYLRAGGRVSNATAMVGNLLGLHPCIEIIDGKLMAQKKYRGDINKVIPKFVKDFCGKYNLRKDKIYLIWSIGLPEETKRIAEKAVMEYGFGEFEWVKTGCVITTHGGPKAFGIVGVEE